MKKLKLFVISHTHWDREWYQTFQNFRYRLVRVMDDLISGLEKDPEYKVFHLDGQTIVLEDYLDIRPENRERLEKLIRDGRIVIGPWFVMPDEFLISGEALVKNLKMGHDICKEYGVKPMKNGFVTDIFGHNSQFPQILNGFGIDSATLYRGIGDFEKDAFCWESPDGSRVKAAKLEAERSYSNFYFAVRWPYEAKGFDEKDAVERMKVLAERARKMSVSGLALMMDGVDHSGMEPELPKMIKLFQENIPDVEFVHTNIEEYFKQLKLSELDTIQGPLYNVARRGINNQVLKNVLSSMVHLKQENDRIEAQLEAVSEPLNAFCEMLELKSYRGDDYSLAPRRSYLDRAWKYLITNQPHDSICGCSLSDVHRDNEYRFRQAGQMAEISARDCVNVISRNIKCTGEHQEAVLLYNPSQKKIRGVHTFTLPVKYQDAPNRRFYDSGNTSIDVQVLEEREELSVNERLRQLVRFDRISVLTAAAEIEIPAFGYTVIYCDNLKNVFKPEDKMYGYEAYFPPCRLQGSQMTAHNKLDNGALTLELNPSGLLDITIKSSGKSYKDLHLPEIRSDYGDGWNWRPARADAAGFGRLEGFSVAADGPLCTVWKLIYFFEAVSGNTQRFTSFVTIPRGSETVYFKTCMDNEAENCRLRVLFPTHSKAESFLTKTPFDLAQWPVKHPDNRDCAEVDTLVYPSQGISCIEDAEGKVALYSKGLYEVEVTDNDEKALALTLFRSAQHESGTAHPGDIKMKRSMTFEYALTFENCGKTESVIRGEAFRSGIKSFPFEQNPEADVLECGGSPFEFACETKIVSTVIEDHGKYYIRIYDVSGGSDDAEMRFPAEVIKAEYVNLNNEPVGEADFNKNRVIVHCPKNKIITVCVELSKERE